MQIYSRFTISHLIRQNFFMENLIFGNVVENWNQWRANVEYDKIIIFSDENVANFWWSKLNTLCDGFQEAELFVVPAGEESKSLEIVAQMYSALTEYQIGRNALWVNLGGGMISDLGGFIASTYKRGLDFVNIPTTLLAQVDASVGGKTGVNFEGFKNHIGVFANPQRVFMDSHFLSTLPQQEMISGFGEVVKHGLIQGGELWEKVCSTQSLDFSDAFLQEVVAVKSDVVKKDPLEKGVRKVLNLGHTLGHAIERFSHKSGKAIPHGHCVLLGLWGESFLFESQGVQASVLKSIKALTQKWVGSGFDFNFPAAELIENMGNDKKNDQGEIRFSLALAPGNTQLDITFQSENLQEKLELWIKELNG
ncbi:MAG: 3-dehydroquinate synthase [Luteibaculaceae bacterium]